MEGEGRRGREGGREQRKRERERERGRGEGGSGRREGGRGGREGEEENEVGGVGRKERERGEREDKIILRDCSELPIPQSLLNQATLWPSPQGPLPGMGCNALYVPPHTCAHIPLIHVPTTCMSRWRDLGACMITYS